MTLSAEELITRRDDLKNDRSTWENTWQKILDVVMPNRAPVVSEETPGTRRGTTTLYDDTAPKANNRLAAALNSTLTNRAVKWFILETDKNELNEDQIVKTWLDEVSHTIRRELENSTFYMQVNEMYQDLGSIGTGILYVDESKRPGRSLHFSTRHIRECCLDLSDEGDVDAVYRSFEMTARQIKQRWKESGTISDEIEKAFEKKPNEKFEIIHVVMPRYERDETKTDRKNLPWASIWIDATHKQIIDEGGYHEFPYMSPVWSRSSGEIYGRSPSLNNLSDILTLNKMKKTLLRTGEKIADPPLNVPDTIDEDVDMTPGGVNYYESGTQDRIVPIDLGSRGLPITLEMWEQQQDDIRDGYLITQLTLIDRRQMTAEEVRQRTQENALILGPTFDRLQSEFLEQLIDRVMGILIRSGKIVDLPDVLKGEYTRVRYVSPLARAQRMSEVQAINTVVGTAQAWSEVRADVLDNIDFDEAIREAADIEGAPPKIIRPMEGDNSVKAIRSERQKLQKQKLQIENAQAAASVAKDAASAQSTREAA